MRKMDYAALRGILLALLCAAIVTACAPVCGDVGYLRCEELPDSMALIPPPPDQGSIALKYDEKISNESLNLFGIGKPGEARWNQAAKDADFCIDPPQKEEDKTCPQIKNEKPCINAFSCVLGVTISEKKTPHLAKLLRFVKRDAGNSVIKAKDYYKRKRPFQENNKPICKESDRCYLEKNGSYPSGHNAIGWAWALVLTEVAPQKSNAILTRGWAFGENRIVCNVHWHSDALEGRSMGAAVVARLHGNPQFNADVEAARKELKDIALDKNKSKQLKPQAAYCNAEYKALKQ
ncbi:MAG TPA: phosphatase PAP2 family protein [Smithella sp.]|nr:phosphatase PAP2 family protein [Smithella sp.]